jgi:hypothetical protein
MPLFQCTQIQLITCPPHKSKMQYTLHHRIWYAVWLWSFITFLGIYTIPFLAGILKGPSTPFLLMAPFSAGFNSTASIPVSLATCGKCWSDHPWHHLLAGLLLVTRNKEMICTCWIDQNIVPCMFLSTFSSLCLKAKYLSSLLIFARWFQDPKNSSDKY